MPKLIDRDARRTELADAVMALIDRAGVASVSVRTVAAEAGVSVGSLRHVLPTKELLIAAAMETLLERARERFVGAAAGPMRTRSDAIRLLEQILPVDDERRREMRAHLSLVLESAAHPGLADLRRHLDDQVELGCRVVLEAGQQAGFLRDDLDLAVETRRLVSLVDGLALFLLGPRDDLRGGPRGEWRTVLDVHLRSLA